MKSILSLLLIMYITTTPVHGVEIIDTITASQAITGLTMANGHLWAGTSGGILRYSEVLEFVGFYTSKSGLPDNSVIDVATAGSRIFAITRTGLVEYDPTGDRFQSVITRKGSLETERFTGSEFAGMAIAGRIILLVMADTRMFVGDLTTYPLDLKATGRLEGTFTTLTSDLSGMFWIGTREGSVFEIDNTGQITGRRKFSRPIQSLNIADDLLYAGTADSLYACSREGVRIQRPLPIDDVVAVIPDDAGIISMSGKGVIRHGRISPFRCATIQSKLPVTCMVTSWDKLLVGTRTGLFVIPLKKIRYGSKVIPERLEAPPAIPNTDCLTAALFNEKLWVGTQSGLLSVPWSPDGASSQVTRHPGILPSSHVKRICSDEETLYIATTKGLVIHDGAAWTVIERSDKLRSSDLPTLVYPTVTDICRDSETGDIWLSDTGTINRGSKGVWQRFNYLNGLKSSQIRRISVQNTRCVAATADRGIEILNKLSGKFITVHPDQKSSVIDVALSESGTIFCLTEGQYLIEIGGDGREIKHLLLPEGGARVEPLCLEIHHGKLWIGTRSGLIFGLPGAWEYLTAADGLTGNVIHEISFYDSFAILATDSGITILSPADPPARPNQW